MSVSPSHFLPSNNWLLSFLVAAWGALLLGGMGLMEREQFTPVAHSGISSDFPRSTALPLFADAPTLILFAHPRCPCTRATFDEFAGILAASGKEVHSIVVFTVPPGVVAGWERGDLLTRAKKLRDVQVVIDHDGAEATRFGVKGSGHVLLYAPSGRLLFSGGITASRGEEGTNPGAEAIVAFVLRGNSPVTRTPVFGCSLL